MICGFLYCPSGCPAYEPENDPFVTGWCEVCGTALYAEGDGMCERCREAARDEKKEDDDGVE